MMTQASPEQLVDELRTAIEQGDQSVLDDCLHRQDPVDSLRAVLQLDEENQLRLLEILPRDEAAELLQELPDSEAAQLVDQLEVPEAAEILNEVVSAGKADILGRLPDATATAILDEMQPEEASDARRLLQYPSETAGGLMISEFLSYRAGQTVDDVLSDLRTNAKKYTGYSVQYAYVVTRERLLVGVLRLRDLLLSETSVPIRELMIRETVTVQLSDSLEDLKLFFDRHHFYGVPVIDAEGKLVGVVRQQDVLEEAKEVAERTLLKLTGILGGEELRTMPLHLRSARRLSWLSVNIVLNILAASVIAMFQDTLAAVIALAVFLPIISDMSGCSGNQAVAVSMRELSLGILRPTEFLRVFWKESAVGIINGMFLGGVLGVMAYLWQGNLALGFVVAAALASNTIIAVCIGGAVPLLLKRLKQDPALASGPILTTVTDMCGFMLVLSLATALLPWLT